MLEQKINNEIYNELGEQWYTAVDNPIALLRKETLVKAPWVIERTRKHFNSNNLSLLDIGCGGGFLSNKMSEIGMNVIGIDISEESLKIARQFDLTKKATYLNANAYQLPFSDSTFDVITCMDFLEHVESPQQVIKEAHRVLKPNGLFFYHTFNRNWLSWFVVIKLVEWFIKNTPPNLHLYKLFIKPEELNIYLKKVGLQNVEIEGIKPNFKSLKITDFFKRIVPDHFNFKLTPNLKVAYLGYAKKQYEI